MADFIVTNINDSGSGSLRQAILDANTTPGSDTITFDRSLSGETITLSSGELSIASDMEISGDLDNDGISDITINASGNSRVLSINDGNASIDAVVRLNGLGVTGGYIEVYRELGSGIFNSEFLTISNSKIYGNLASTAFGVGIGNRGRLELSNSTIKDNSAVVNESNSVSYGYGGGIYNSGSLTVKSSTISGNKAGSEFAGSGGGIFNTDSGTLELANSTISGNESGYAKDVDNQGIAAISSTTILGEIENSGSLQLTNSIVGEIIANRTIQTYGINLVGNGAAPRSLTLDPQLGPLQNNGGTIETHALLAESPAINLGDNSLLPSDINDLDGDGNISESLPFDQRGTGFNRIENGTVDVGSFEKQGASNITPPATSLNFTVDTLVDENDFDLSPGDLSLREAIAFLEDGGTITFDPSLSGGRILLNSSLVVSKSLTIEGLGANQLTISSNQDNYAFDRIFLIDDGNDSINQSIEISGLTLTGGSPGGRYDIGTGAAINNRETLTISSSHITGNAAFGNSGGGIFNYETGVLTVSDSTISDNYASYGGAGIYNLGDLTLSNSTVSGNESTYARGAGLQNSNGANATVLNSTFYNLGGYEIDIYNEGGTVQIISSLIPSISNSNYVSGSISAQSSLIERGRFDDDLGGNITGLSPNFAPEGLQDNGGSTPTISLQSSSPAIDAGLNPNNLPFDQRGPGFSRETGSAIDIGAFEFETEAPRATIDLGLFDADTDSLIATLDDGTTVLASELVERSLNIAATIPNGSPFAGEVESIFLDLNDGDVTRTENSEPYALFGDRSGDFFRGSVPIGRNTISLDLFSENRRRGALLGTVERSFTIADDLTGLDIGLFDADTDERIVTLFDGAEVDSALLDGREVNIAAIVSNVGPFSEQVESIFLNLNNGAVTRTENSEPYAIFGDRSGDFFGGSLPIGDNTLSFELYSDNRRRGDLIDTVSIDFSIG